MVTSSIALAFLTSERRAIIVLVLTSMPRRSTVVPSWSLESLGGMPSSVDITL